MKVKELRFLLKPVNIYLSVRRNISKGPTFQRVSAVVASNQLQATLYRLVNSTDMLVPSSSGSKSQLHSACSPRYRRAGLAICYRNKL